MKYEISLGELSRSRIGTCINLIAFGVCILSVLGGGSAKAVGTYYGHPLVDPFDGGEDDTPPLVILGEYSTNSPLSSSTVTTPAGNVQAVLFYGGSYSFTLYALAYAGTGSHANEQRFTVVSSTNISGTFSTVQAQTVQISNFPVNSGDFLAFAGTGPYYAQNTNTDQLNLDATYENSTNVGSFKATPPAANSTFSVGIHQDTNTTYDYITNQFNNQGRIYAIGVDICPTIKLSPSSLPAGTAGCAFNGGSGVTVSATGGASPYTYSISGSADGLSINPGSGLLSGTIASEGGPFNFTVIATDTNGCTGSTNYALTVSCPSTTLQPSSGALTPGTVGTAYNETITASGGCLPYTFSRSGSLPAGLNLSTSGAITGTPTAEGTSTFSVTAIETNGCGSSNQYTLQICGNITLTPGTLPNGTIGAGYPQQQFSASGGDGPYTYSWSGNPSGLNLSTSGALTGTPNGTANTYHVTVTATDTNNCSGSTNITLIINCPAIRLSPGTLPNGTIGVSYPQQQFSASGGDGHYTYSWSGNPSGLNLSSSGALTGTPSGATGPYTVTVTATDTNNCSGSTNITLTISCPTINLNPPAGSLADGTVGVSYGPLTLTASGGQGSYTFVTNSGTLPPGISLSSGGTLSGTCNTPGTYSFCVKATDTNNCTGSACYTLTVCSSITLTPGPLSPCTDGISYNSKTLTASGGSGGYSFAVTGGALPNGLSLSPNGSTVTITGRPEAPAGVYPFTITVTETNNGCTGSQSYNLTNDCPVAPNYELYGSLYTGSVGVYYDAQIEVLGGEPPYMFSAPGGMPSGLSLSPSGQVTGTEYAEGSYDFDVFVTDANGCPLLEGDGVLICANITLSPPSLPPGVLGAPYGPQQITPSGGVAPYSFAISGSAGGLMINPTNGVLSGTPTNSSCFTVTATDANGCTGSIGYCLTNNSCTPPPAGMVLWLPFDETNGNTFANIASPADPGTQTGNPSHWPGEYVDNSLIITNYSYVTVPDYPGIEIGTNDLTIDAWVYPQMAWYQTNAIVVKSALEFGALSGTQGPGYSLQLCPGNGPTLYLGQNEYNAGAPISSNNWHFVAVTVSHSTSTVLIYVDGVVTGAFPLTSVNVFNTNALTVGMPFNYDDWQGALDEVEVYNSALSTNELNDIFVARTAGKCKPCITIQCPNIITNTCLSCVSVPLMVTANDTCCTNVFSPIYYLGASLVSATNNCFDVNTTNLVQVVVSDACGNSATNSFTVTVLPGNCQNCLSYACPSNLVVVAPCGYSCVVVSNYPPVFATNYCNPSNLTVSYSVTLPYCFPVGTTPVDLTVSGSGQSNTCPFLVIVPTNNYNQVVFSDLTMSDPGNWTSNNSYGALNNNPIDDEVNWGVHYTSALGVPQDPYSSSTTALQLKANETSGNQSGVSVSPAFLSLSGNFTMTFDLWLNYNSGGFTTGSTQVGCYGLTPAANQVQGPSGVGGGQLFGEVTDTSSTYYRGYNGGATIGAGPFVAGSQSDTASYYTGLFPSVNVPATETALDTNQYGSTLAGTVSFQWLRVSVTYNGGILSESINGNLIASYATANPGSDIFLGMYDVNNGSAGVTGLADQNYALFDNLAVTIQNCPLTNGCSSFTYTNFGSNYVSGSGLQLQGNASFATGVEGTPVLRLTPAARLQAGSAFLPVQLGNNLSFSTEFSFQMSNGGGNPDGTGNPPGADGITFVLTDSAGLGGNGFQDGYAGIPNSVAIKFDTWQDGGQGGYFPTANDPNGNFVAVYTDGSVNTAGYIPYSSGNDATQPQYYSPPTSMKNGDVWYAWIDYDGDTSELDVYLSDGVDSPPATPQLVQNISLNNWSILGPNPQLYAGFTSGTGNAYDNNDILNWQFNTVCSNACLSVQCTDIQVTTCSNVAWVPLSAVLTDLCCTNPEVTFVFDSAYGVGYVDGNGVPIPFSVNTTNEVDVYGYDNCGNMVQDYFTVTVLPGDCCNNLGPNLVPNPGFELYSNCPTGSSQFGVVTDWLNPTLGTPDYFNACAGAGGGGVGVPGNFAGYCPAHGGNGYAGGWMLNDQDPYGTGPNAIPYREYIQVPLLSPLQAGQTYTVSFYVCLASNVSNCGLDNLGAYLSVGKIGDSVYNNDINGGLPVTPQVRNPAGIYITSFTNWTLIQGTYVAAGGESYLTLGNFYDDAHSPVMPVGGFPPPGTNVSYYYFDDVSVQENLCTVTNACSDPCIQFYGVSNQIVQACDSCVPVYYNVSAFDFCCSNSPVTLTFFPTNGTCWGLGSTGQVQVTATSTCGHCNTTNFTVTIVRGNCQAAACITLECTNEVAYTCGGCTPVVYGVSAGDACCSVPPTLTFNPPQNSCLPLGTNVISVTATDACGNETISNFTVTVLPESPCTGPCISIQCTNIAVVTCSNCGTVPFNVTTTDACCSNSSVRLTFNPPTNTCFPVNSTTLVQVFAVDGCTNIATNSFWVTVVPGTCSNCIPAPEGLTHWWTGNSNTLDIVGGDTGIWYPAPNQSDYTVGQNGGAFSFEGSYFLTTSDAIDNPQNFTLDLWFRTAGGAGVLFGFGQDQNDDNGQFDRTIYMDNNGRLHFGVWTGSAQTADSTAAYNDGNWHNVAATESSSGAALYVDGNLVASNPSATPGENFTGYWKIGENGLQYWPYQPTSTYFLGTIDQVLIYGVPLSLQEIENIYQAGPLGTCPSSSCSNCLTFAEFSTNAVAGSGVTFMGNAAFTTGLEGTPVLRLTPAVGSEKGSAFWPVQLGDNLSFNTEFAFQLADGAGVGSPPGADGITFTLTTAPGLGNDGGGIGYEGIPASVAVKFDTYHNGGSPNSDPNDNFVAVYTDGNIDTGGYIPYSPLNSGTQPQYYEPPTLMKNGDIWYAWIDYNGASGELDVRLSDGVDSPPATPQLTQFIGLNNTSILGFASPLYAGFTAATGAGWETQDILNWQICSPCTNACLSILCTNIVAYTCGSNCLTVPFAARAVDICCTNTSAFLQYYVIQGTNSIPISTPPSYCFPANSTNTVEVVATDGCGNIVSNYFTVAVMYGPGTLAIKAQQQSDSIILTWSQGVLQASPPSSSLAYNETVAGPYSDVPGAVSPYIVPASGATRFYRLRCPCTTCACLALDGPTNVTVISCECTNLNLTNYVGVADNCCTNWSLSFNYPPNFCFAVSNTYTIQATVTDTCGNNATHVFQLIVLPCSGTVSNSCLSLDCPGTIYAGSCSNAPAYVNGSATMSGCTNGVTVYYFFSFGSGAGFSTSLSDIPFQLGTNPVSVCALQGGTNTLACCSFEVIVTNLNCSGAGALAQWTFEVSQPQANQAADVALANILPELGGGSASALHQAASTYSTPAGNGSDHSFAANNWTAGDYFQFTCSTANAGGIGVAWDQVSSATGPGLFQLQYSTDGANFLDFGPPYAVAANGSLAGPTSHWGSESNNPTTHYVQDLGSVPGLANAAHVWFRLVDVSSNSAAGGLVGAYGVSRVDNFTVIGGSLVGSGGIPEITWSDPAPITYGTPLGQAQLNAMSSVPGTFTYVPPAGTILSAGSNFLQAIFTPSSSGYGTTSFVSQVVFPRPLTLSADNFTRMVGDTNPVFTGTILGLADKDIDPSNSLPLGFTSSATPASPPGEYSIIPFITLSNLNWGNYILFTNPGTITVTSNNCGCSGLTILKWTFEVSRPSADEPAGVPITGILPEFGYGMASGLHQEPAIYSHPAGNGSTNSFCATNWTVGDYYQFACSNLSLCSEMSAAWDQVSSATGPGMFQLQYSKDGMNFSNLGLPYQVYVNDDLPGPDAFWNATTFNPYTHYIQNLSSITQEIGTQAIWFRLVDVADTSADGDIIGPSGSSRVDNFTITGTEIVP